METADVERLRAHGLDDRAIVDANQVVSYFNYVNRVADGLGVELEPSWPPELRERRRTALAVSGCPRSPVRHCRGSPSSRCARSTA